jgi:hypothetical protein
MGLVVHSSYGGQWYIAVMGVSGIQQLGVCGIQQLWVQCYTAVMGSVLYSSYGVSGIHQLWESVVYISYEGQWHTVVMGVSGIHMKSINTLF